HRSEYLDELVRLKGRGDHASDGNGSAVHCTDCGSADGVFRCTECFGRDLVCQGCCLTRHAQLPLHRLERWTGTHFAKESLHSLGYSLQLGHSRGMHCITRHKRMITVFHVNGLHQVTVYFCGCDHSAERRQQLLRCEWYPATPLDPETCATFDLLRLFHIQNLQGNITAYDFYHALEMRTDGWQSSKLPDRRQTFMLIVREWRNLQALKRAGRCHDPAGVAGTKEGELAIPCRACPHPGVNLPDDWDTAPESEAYLYRQVVSIDCNFRVKSRYRKSNKPDVCLSPGWSYMVEHSKYEQHYTKYASQEEISNCVEHRAIGQANMKKHKGLNATGVVAASCRHELFRPNGLGDLQRGERHCNVDYIFLSALVGVAVLYLLATYDIACQYFTNFWSRMPNLPTRLHLKIPRASVSVKVPKAHLEVHKTECHGPFSLNWFQGACRTCGEGVERLWSWLNKAAPSVKEMTVSCRRETIDDFCSYAGWRKTLGLGHRLPRQLIQAIKEARIHRDEFQAFDENLRSRFQDLIPVWSRKFTSWEHGDHSDPCPYIPTLPRITMAGVREAIAIEEERTHATPTDDVNSTKTPTPLGFILLGLEIEAQQRALAEDVRVNPSLSVLDRSSRTDRRRALRKKIIMLRDLQRVFMPLLSSTVCFAPNGAIEDADGGATQEVEHVPLFLPSHPALESSRSAICDKTVIDVEMRLREAQAHEALDDLRHQLRIRTFANKYKKQQITGQRMNLRARKWQQTIDERAASCAARYRVAREALLRLRGPGDWEKSLKPLHDEDIRAINDRALTQHELEERRSIREAGGLPVDGIFGQSTQDGVEVGEGRRTLSWIWLVDGGDSQSDSDPHVQEVLRIEWGKCRSRRDRWEEQVKSVRHEMMFVIQYTRWKATWWREQARRRHVNDYALSEGLAAYALEHAAQEHSLAERWERLWAPVAKTADEYLRNPDADSVPASATPVASSSTSTPSEATVRSTAFVEITIEDDDEGDGDDDEELDEEEPQT
ncbi:hypothetical protein PHLGIDRAFT_80565, partial [Phlebiopsis gigantea 11061_1 CR5-6]